MTTPSTQVVLMEAGRLDLGGPELDALASIETELQHACRVEGTWSLERALQRADATLNTIDLPEIAAALAAYTRPATEDEISQHLADTIGAFPYAKPADPETYARMLFAEVTASQPSITALDAGCSSLRRSCVFLPAIAEVLDRVEALDRLIRRRVRVLRVLPQLMGRARQELAERQEQLHAELEKKAALRVRRDAAIRSAIEAGQPTTAWHFQDVYAVRKAMAAENGEDYPRRS